MTDINEKTFYGICIEEEEVDERLGIMDELLEIYSKEEAEDLYEGALENCGMIFNNDYFFYDESNSLYYFGKFIDYDNNVELQKREIFNEISKSIKLSDEEMSEHSIIIDQ